MHHILSISLQPSSKTEMSNLRRKFNDFENAKLQALGKTKRDKSSAGRIDAKAVEICAAVNARRDMYTTSSCSGRCFFYIGEGIKSTTSFVRFRVNHDIIRDGDRYFDLATLRDGSDPTGGGDIIPEIGQYDYKGNETNGASSDKSSLDLNLSTIWFRYEPFILHVACRSLRAAEALMAAARPSFKNVGITSLSRKSNGKIIVGVWGDEGLELPYVVGGKCLYDTSELKEFLQRQVNEMCHARNWDKIRRFVEAVNEMPSEEELLDTEIDSSEDPSNALNSKKKSFDVIGDVAVLNSLEHAEDIDPEILGQQILNKNKAIKVVAARANNLQGSERKPNQLQILAGIHRSPMMTSHKEFGVACVIDLEECFFAPRMASERLRLCQQVARGEHVLVVFSGVGMEALQIAAKTECTSITTIELNKVAVQCGERGKQLLSRNSSLKGAQEKANKITLLEGDAMEVLPTLPLQYYHRIVAPRPKESEGDCDIAGVAGGKDFLTAMLPHVRHDGGEVHWYDFVSDQEYPTIDRTKKMLQQVGDSLNLSLEVLNVQHVGSVAKRQLRACIDIKVFKK